MFFTSAPSVSPADAAMRINAGALLIDVRSPAEYASGHAKGAKNLALHALTPEQLDQLKQADSVFVICHSGARSNAATKALIAAGINAMNVTGGTAAWRATGLPMG